MLTFVRIVWSLVLLACFLVPATGCRPEYWGRESPSPRLQVVCTVGMITDAVKIIGGDAVEPIGLMGPGVDPHLYRATAQDVRRLDRAEVVFYGGLELEGRMSEIFEKLTVRGKTVVAVTQDIDRGLLQRPAAFEGRYDPHVWFDVTLWKSAVQVIADTLAKELPYESRGIRRRAAAYLKELDMLHEYVHSRARELQPEQRLLVTAHDAFGYFGRQYGFDVMAIQGTSTASEASALSIIRVAEAISRRQIRAIFVETSVPRSTVEALQKSAQSKGWDVQIGGSLYSDAMGEEGTADGTYTGMVMHNIDTIVESLK